MKKSTIFAIVMAVTILVAVAVVYVCVINDSGPVTSVTDCQGHTYPVIKVGEQYWMAENLQCTKYDTQSERAGEILHTTDTRTSAPHYVDCRIKSNWSEETYRDAKFLSEEQIKKLGLLYNWTAAMGYESASEIENYTREYWERRQGICPNGWHIPSRADWNLLVEAIGGETEEDLIQTVPHIGAVLQSNSGWYGGGSGTDEIGFSVLPAGFAMGNTLHCVGTRSFIWSVNTYDGKYVYYKIFTCDDSDLHELFSVVNTAAISVRCVMD
ncbi:MAG: hypothetical protein MJ009_03655 [Paludibacteraceae bacterium]|nr:hypothetical protein [Paludibacteraceae bacterium]